MMHSYLFSPGASQQLTFIRIPSKRAVQLLTSLLALSLYLFPTLAAAQSPHIYDVPKAGPPGSQVTTVGNGFDPNATLDLYFDSTDVGLVDTDNNGSFGMALRAPTIRQNGFTIHVPDDAVPGQHWITAVERITQLQAQVPFTVSVDWPQFQFDAQHTGHNPYENVLSSETVGNLRFGWMHLIGTWINSPTVWNGIVYLSSDKLYAFDATTGALLWANPAPLALWGAPAVANGILYLGGTDGTNGWIYAINATTGVTIWKYLDDGASAPTVVNGVVYVSGYYYLYALDASTGAILWKYQGAEGGVTAPAVANGVVYVGYEFGQMHALNATTGALIWQYTTGGWIRSASLAVVDGIVYVGTAEDNNVYALNAETGALLWKYTTGGEVFSSPAVAKGVVYVGSDDDNLYALDAGTGALLWKYTTGGMVVSSPAVANGVVYVGSNDKNVYALEATTGALLWKYTTRGNIAYSSPAVANGMVYIMSEQSLYAFGLPNQQMAEKVSPPERPDPARLTPNWSLQPSHVVTNKSVKPQ